MNNLRLYTDDDGHCVAQENIGSPLVAIASQEQMDEMRRKCAENYEREQKARKAQEEKAVRFRPDGMTTRLFCRGFAKIQQCSDWCYVRNIPGLRNKPLRVLEIVADDNICVINNEFLFLKQEPRLWYKVFKRTDDFSYFVVKEHEAHYKDYIGIPDITIIQSGDDGLKMERKRKRKGVPYTPYYQPELKPQWMKPRRTPQ